MRALAAFVLVGCTVGPAYHRPPAPRPETDHYKNSWKIATPSDGKLRGDWWKLFGETELDELVLKLNAGNQTILQAYENYLAARAQIRQARAAYFPLVTASPSVTYSRGATFSGTSTTNPSTAQPPTTVTTSAGARRAFFAATAQASWVPDLFGRVRNNVRQFQYGAQASAADFEGVRLAAQTALVQAYFQLRGQDALQNILDATVEADQRILELATWRFEHGVDTELSVVQANQTLQAARAQAIDSQVVRAQLENAIAALVGVPASSFTLPKRALLPSPPAIPSGVPSQLLERRPDIAAAERRMAQANAIIGIGYAAYYPTLTLTSNAGFASTALETLFTWPSRVWSIGAALSETIFDGGLRRATIDQSIAAYNASVAFYRQTVLTAFQEVENGLAQLRILAQEIEVQRQAVTLAQQALELERARYETGIDPFQNLMIQQTTLLGAQQTLVALQVQQMTAAAALIEALGGGWDRAQLPSPGEVTKKPPSRDREIMR